MSNEINNLRNRTVPRGDRSISSFEPRFVRVTSKPEIPPDSRYRNISVTMPFPSSLSVINFQAGIRFIGLNYPQPFNQTSRLPVSILAPNFHLAVHLTPFTTAPVIHILASQLQLLLFICLRSTRYFLFNFQFL